MSYQSEVLADLPLGYWRMASGTGRLLDSSVNGRALSTDAGIVDAASLLPSDPGNAAAQFNTGSAMWSADAAFKFTGTSAFTVELLLAVTDLDATFRRAIGMSDDGSGTQNGYSVQYHSTVGVFVCRYSAGAIVSTQYLPSTWTRASKVHIGMTYDGATTSLVIDGVLRGQQPDARSLGAYAGHFNIGVGQFGGTASGGIIDEVAIYGSSLSQARLAAHFAEVAAVGALPIHIGGRGAC